MIFTRLSRSSRSASTFALAIALATGATVGAAALATPASAAKKDKGEKKNYSPDFVKVYQPLAEQASAEAPDWAALAGQVPALIAAAQTEDDKMVAGNLAFNVGTKAQDAAMQAQGMEMMLASGKVPAENLAKYNMVAGQLAYNAKDYAKARTYMEKAIELGYTGSEATAVVAETYFNQDQYGEGLAYLTRAIEAREAAGETVDESWIKRGLSVAYQAGLKAEANKYALMYVDKYPSKDAWGDAVAISLNTGGYQNPEILDLLRLARAANALRDARTYAEYLEAADYRRLPAEVVAVIDEGFNSGIVPKTDPGMIDTRAQAARRMSTDKAELPNLVSNALGGSADLRSVMAAADTALSFDDAASAEKLYNKALGLSGVETPMVLTRLGIAQFEQGKYDEAKQTFARVEGARKDIANLWAAYVAQKMTGGM